MSNRHLKDEPRYRPLVWNGCFKYMLCHLLSTEVQRKCTYCNRVIREFKKLLWQSRRQHRLKMNLYFTFESRDTLRAFTLFIPVQAVAKLNLGLRNKFETAF